MSAQELVQQKLAAATEAEAAMDQLIAALDAYRDAARALYTLTSDARYLGVDRVKLWCAHRLSALGDWGPPAPGNDLARRPLAEAEAEALP